ncbi:MAG: FkbM family methyltransferase [Chloroflexi bacterium]|nr:FkbM family methyltransferase [Chloroflexota bacterium]
MSSILRVKDFALSGLALGNTLSEKWAIFWRQTKNIRVRLHLGQYHPQEVYRLNTAFGPLYFRDNFGDITNLANLLYREVYPIKQLSPPGVILDVGANIGLAAVWFSHFNPEREIYCLEPIPDNVAMIRRNCPQAHVKAVAVGAGEGEIELAVDADNVMAAHNMSYTWETAVTTFKTISLDNFVAAQRITQIALLKMDTEGSELDIFSGAQQTLLITQQVAMETHGEERHNSSRLCLQAADFIIDDEEFDGQTGMIFASRPE